MATAQLYLGAYQRSGFPSAAALNVLAERDPTSQVNPTALIARPGLAALQTVGTAPIRAIFQRNGLYGDAAIVVDSTQPYTLTAGGVATAFTGTTIAGSDLVDIAAAQDSGGVSIARFANGSAMYLATGTSLAAETFPDSGNAGATSVQYIGGYWLGSVPDTDFAYYIPPGSTTWGAIQFAAAEYAFDRLVGIRVFGELIAMLGEETTEIWRLTGDAASPLEPAGGLKFDVGCRNIFAAVNCAGTLVWVDQNGSVWMTSGGSPTLISGHSEAEQFRNAAAADIRATYWVKDQHPVCQFTLGTDATLIYDLTSKTWTNASSLGVDYWRAHLACNIGDAVLMADSLSNQVWTMDPDRRTDGDDVFTVRFMARIEVPEGVMPLASVTLDCLLGDAPRTGQGSDPLIGMGVYRDGFTPPTVSYRSTGITGHRTVSPRWNAQGMLRSPFGGLLEFTVSDPVGRRFSAVRYNVT